MYCFKTFSPGRRNYTPPPCRPLRKKQLLITIYFGELCKITEVNPIFGGTVVDHRKTVFQHFCLFVAPLLKHAVAGHTAFEQGQVRVYKSVTDKANVGGLHLSNTFWALRTNQAVVACPQAARTKKHIFNLHFLPGAMVYSFFGQPMVYTKNHTKPIHHR